MSSEKTYRMPPIVWLKMTDYMLGWLQHELGGGASVCGMRVICVQHLPGARKILRMETAEDVQSGDAVVNSMSDTWKNCLEAGIDLDASAIESTYGLTREGLKVFVPVECPKICLTKDGVLRPWTLDVTFGREQASAMQRLLRDAFWKAVDEYDAGYRKKMDGRKYPAIDMIEDFCAETGTQDIYADAMRREWQRRCKRADG